MWCYSSLLVSDNRQGFFVNLSFPFFKISTKLGYNFAAITLKILTYGLTRRIGIARQLVVP